MPCPCHWLWEGRMAWWRAHGRGSALQKGFLEGRHPLAQRRQHKLCVSATQSPRGDGNGHVTCHPREVSGRGASSGTCWIPLMARLIAKDNGTSEWCPLPVPSCGHVADSPGPAAASCRFCSPALLVHLAVGFPSLPLRPAAGKQGEKGELRQVDMSRQLRMSGERHQIPAALPSVTREKWCLPVFLTFLQRLVPGWAW